MVLALAGCGKSDASTNTEASQTTTETTTENIAIDNPEEIKSTLVGTWVREETISPQKFYGDYYNDKITKTSVQMRTTYTFNEDGTCSTLITITNISDVRKEYRSLMVEGARQKSESEGKFLTTDKVLYYEKKADNVLNDICKPLNSTYEIQGNKLVFGDSTTETFTLYANKLVFENSQTNGGSQIEFNRQ